MSDRDTKINTLKSLLLIVSASLIPVGGDADKDLPTCESLNIARLCEASEPRSFILLLLAMLSKRSTEFKNVIAKGN